MADPAPTLSEDHDPDGPAAWERALLDRQLEALSRLADMGMAIAGAIERRVTAAEAQVEPDAVLHHAAIDFARVSRAVRLCFALQGRLIADFKTPPRARSSHPVNDDDDEDWTGPMDVVWLEPDEDPREAQKRKVQAIVRERAEAEALDREAVERLVLEADERLDHEDARRGLFGQPFEDLVALICRDLGLEPPAAGAAETWSARAPPAEAGVRAIVEDD